MLKDSYLHTLGDPSSMVIDRYYDQYYRMLFDFLHGWSDPNMLTKDFLLTPDVSSVVERMRLDESYRELWSRKLRDLLAWDRGIEEIIPGTHICLTIEDANPDAHIDTHPDHHAERVHIGWGDISVLDWLDLYARSFVLLRQTSPGFFWELDRMIRKIIPLGVSSRKHNSASYSSCIGHLYMSYPTDMEYPELAILEAIIHESNHNKLNLIMKSDPLVLNIREETYYSPYRPDPRHIHGIYLGLHAMVAVFSVFFFMHRDRIVILDSSWLEKSLTYVMKNALAIRTIDRYAHLTGLGRTIFDEMRRVHEDTLEIIRTLPIDSGIRSYASARVRKHFHETIMSYPAILY